MTTPQMCEATPQAKSHPFESKTQNDSGTNKIESKVCGTKHHVDTALMSCGGCHVHVSGCMPHAVYNLVVPFRNEQQWSQPAIKRLRALQISNMQRYWHMTWDKPRYRYQNHGIYIAKLCKTLQTCPVHLLVTYFLTKALEGAVCLSVSIFWWMSWYSSITATTFCKPSSSCWTV